MNNPIPIFYTIDDDYADLAIVSITSLIAHANPAHTYNIHIIYQTLSESHLAELADLSQPGFNVILNALGEELSFIENRTGNRLNGSIFSLSIYFRLFIPEAFPEYEKGIYLDADTVVPGDISELYAFDLENHLLGGSHDLSIASIPDFINYIEQGDGVPFDGYINSGVLLLNMTALRAVHLRDRFLELFMKYHANTVAPDQDYLNVLCAGHIAYFDRAWNCMPAPGLEPLSEPKLIHYNLFYKPWHYQDTDYADYFWSAARAAGREGHFRAELGRYDVGRQAADSAALDSMLAQSRDIIAQSSGLGPLFADGRARRLK